MKLVKKEDYEKERARLKHIIVTTKSYKCKQDHLKALKKLDKEFKQYIYNLSQA